MYTSLVYGTTGSSLPLEWLPEGNYGFLSASSLRCNSASSSSTTRLDSLIGLFVGTDTNLPLIEMPISSNTLYIA